MCFKVGSAGCLMGLVTLLASQSAWAAITPGAAYEFEAASDLSGDANWLNVGQDPFEAFTFSRPAATSTVSDTKYPGLLRAYQEPAQGVSNAYESHDGSTYSRGDATFELMVFPNQFAGQQVLLEVGGSARGILLALSDSDLTFWVDGDATAEISAPLPSAAQWYHIAASIEPTDNKITLYVDGVEVGSATASSDITDWSGGNPAGLGQVASSYPDAGTVGAAGPFDGQIAAMRFYPTALTAQQINTNCTHYTIPIEPPPPVDGPNIVILMSDDAGFADWGFQGSTVIPTPNLDALAAQGVFCTNAYTASVCSPSRAMLTTGMYGARFGYELNIADDDSVIGSGLTQGLPPELPTMFDRMQALGYTTGMIGKWHIGKHQDQFNHGQLVAAGNRPQRQGLDEFWGLLEGSRQYFVGSESNDKRLRVTTVDNNGQVADQIVENDYSGQYVTDVFGDWTVNFIRRHHRDEQPFMLYTSFTAPHTPIQATDEDLAAIDAMGNGLSGNRRTYAAMQRAMDRNVGKVLQALADPNGDGDPNASLLDNTLIIFLNDNGGDCCDSSPNFSSNTPLKSGKGTQWEGGIRIPMIFAGAGLDPAMLGSRFNAPVHSIDILPTMIKFAGGDLPTEQPLDGVDLLPYLNGEATGEPHDTLYIRRFAGEQTAIRSGDWKLVCRPATGIQLFDLISDIGESNDRAAEYPEVVADLTAKLTAYDVQMDKPRHDNSADDTNQFDDFRFRSESMTAANWSDANAWTQTSGSGEYTLTYRDAYANMSLTFATADNDYSATNDLTRVGTLTFLMNEFRFESGSIALAGAHQATLDGLPVILANRLDGKPAELVLDASAPLAEQFAFQLRMELQLYDDLLISGDGNQLFQLAGPINEFRPGRNITKTGASTVHLIRSNELTGSFNINEGAVVAGANGSLGAGQLRIGAQGTLEADAALGTFTDLLIDAGGAFKVDLYSLTQFGQIDCGGDISLNGNLIVDAADLSWLTVDDRIPIITFAGQRSGAFATFSLTSACAANGLTLEVGYDDNSVYLEAVPVNGDFDANTAIDMQDFAQLQRCVCQSNPCDRCCGLADLNGDGVTDSADWLEYEMLINGPLAARDHKL